MGYCELAVVVFIALLVLSPQELKDCALSLVKVWRWLQSVKATIAAEVLKTADSRQGRHEP